ncbi:hybrid sensor histidine kinase/response regulator [Dysgonomonas reticulitermitis]
MRILHQITLILFLLLYANSLLGQIIESNLSFENINITEGLPHNTVQKIFQDSEGYMWFATKDGLSRYDGSNYIIYRESLGRESLSNSKVRCISEDNDKNIWAGTDNGLNMIDPATRHVVSFLLSSYPELKNNKINDLFFDKTSQNMWIGTESGVALYNTERKEFIDLESNIAFSQLVNTIGAISEDEIYIGTHTGLYICNKQGKQIYRVLLSPDDVNYNVYSVFPDSDGNIWIGCHMGLLGKMNKPEKTISILEFGNINMTDDYGVVSIIEQDSLLWLISKKKGVFFYNKKNSKLIKTGSGYSVNILGENSNELMLTNAYKNNNGTIWIGSYYMGLFYYSEYINQFNHISIRRDREKSTGIIGPVIQDGDGLWLGSSGVGITYYNIKNKKQQYYEIYESGISLTECKPLLISDNILWIGTDSHGIFLFDLKKKAVIKQYYTSSHIGRTPGNRINYGFKDNQGRLWIGYNGAPGGICLFDDETEIFTNRLPSDAKNKVRDIYFIHQASDNELWVGTRNNGLFRYDISKADYTPIPIAGRQDLSISYIFKDSQNRIWIGTFGQGLICMDYHGNIKQLFNYSNNDINDNICSILEDNDGRIWISSFNEISYYNEQNNRFVKYDIKNNFPLQHVKSMSSLFSKDNLLYFGGSNGMVEVNPQSLMHINKTPPKVVLTDFLIHNQPVDTFVRKDVLQNRIIELKYNQQNLTFHFAALNYIYPEKNQYRYKLEGVDNDWNTTSKQRQVTYNNLTAGEYRFMISACNNSEIWSEPENLLTIIVKPAPWFSWWAYLIYTTVIVGILGLVFYYQRIKINLEHNLKLKNVEKKNMEKMHKFRLDLFTNFSHEIRTPLTFISVSLSDLLKKSETSNNNTLVRIESNVDKISTLVDQLMDFRKHDEGRMELNASEQLLIPFIEDIVLTFKELSEIKNHPLKVNLPKENLILWYNPQLLEKVFYNVLMNAFKYSYEESIIELNAEVIILNGSTYRERVDHMVEQAVLVSIFNEGDTIPESKLEKLFEPFYRLKNASNIQGTGIGLSLNRMIMRLHHSDIWVENAEGQGIVFKLLIPIGKDHLKDELDESAGDEYQVIFSPVAVRKMESPLVFPKADTELRTLLLVEDNEEIRTYLKGKLLAEYNVFDCSNGKEALDIIHKKEIDMVISDVMMPVMDGKELCRIIKSTIEINHIPVILLTAQTSDEHIKEGFYSGANEYIPKPFKYDILLARIQNLLENNDRLRQSFQKRISPKDMNVEVTDYDEQFLQKCYDYLRSNLSNPELTIEDFGKKIGVSRVHLYRKLKYLTNLSPSQFILNVRLKVAADLLRQEGVSVSEVCYQVGFNSLSYFTRCFKQSYGQSPSDYKQKK